MFFLALLSDIIYEKAMLLFTLPFDDLDDDKEERTCPSRDAYTVDCP